LTLRITKLGEQVEAEEVDRDNVSAYWGFIVSSEKCSFAGLLENRKFDLTIATSKLGAKFAEVAEEMAVPWKSASTILLGFGAPARGLPEIARDEGKNLNDLVDFVVNTIPNQGTETVRTEEAVLATLAILNLQFYF
jgi:predicted SPOUT superfamily RNA methylase MTH1